MPWGRYQRRISRSRLVAGCWLLGAGCWLLVSGFRHDSHFTTNSLQLAPRFQPGIEAESPKRAGLCALAGLAADSPAPSRGAAIEIRLRLPVAGFGWSRQSRPTVYVLRPTVHALRIYDFLLYLRPRFNEGTFWRFQKGF